MQLGAAGKRHDGERKNAVKNKKQAFFCFFTPMLQSLQ